MRLFLSLTALLAIAGPSLAQTPAPPVTAPPGTASAPLDADQTAVMQTLADRLQSEIGDSIRREAALRERIAELQGELRQAQAAVHQSHAPSGHGEGSPAAPTSMPGPRHP